jgi:hypothetical protein
MTTAQPATTADLDTTTNFGSLLATDIRYPYRATSGSAGTNAGGAAVYNNTTTNNALFGSGLDTSSNPGCQLNGQTTFLNQDRPATALTASWNWLRENPADSTSPVKIARNGDGFTLPPPPTAPNPAPVVPSKEELNAQKPQVSVGYNSSYYKTTDTRARQNAQNSRVNSIVISGIVPSRLGQSYGGLHNFPRFLETWDKLWFSGSFLQLSFSNYATAPFDQRYWEPSGSPNAGSETINYYSPPARLWGYDVALQMSPAGPAAARFVTASKDRNEFYNEPPANDPYINNLCTAAKKTPPTGVDLSNLNCPS